MKRWETHLSLKLLLASNVGHLLVEVGNLGRQVRQVRPVPSSLRARIGKEGAQVSYKGLHEVKRQQKD